MTHPVIFWLSQSFLMVLLIIILDIITVSVTAKHGFPHVSAWSFVPGLTKHVTRHHPRLELLRVNTEDKRSLFVGIVARWHETADVNFSIQASCSKLILNNVFYGFFFFLFLSYHVIVIPFHRSPRKRYMQYFYQQFRLCHRDNYGEFLWHFWLTSATCQCLICPSTCRSAR